MVATANVGRVAAELLQEAGTGQRVVELEGPSRTAPRDVAATFERILGHPVRVGAVPRETWASLFQSQGMRYPMPRIQMLEGFNEGWIDFEGRWAGSMKGRVELETVLEEVMDSRGPCIVTRSPDVNLREWPCRPETCKLHSLPWAMSGAHTWMSIKSMASGWRLVSASSKWGHGLPRSNL